MIFAALALVLAVTVQTGPGKTGNNDLASAVALVRRHLATSELSAHQVKFKAGGAPEGRAVLEKQYGEVSAAVDSWRAAATATTGQDWSSAQKRIEGLAKTAARAIVDFGRDARRYMSGGSPPVDPQASALIEQRLMSVARAFAEADEAARQKHIAALALRPWSEIAE
jgi:hypothetical protein